MAILFVMPTWQAPSEVWLQRMIEMLQDDIALIAAYDAEESWNGKIPGFKLRPQNPPRRFWIRGLEKARNLFIAPKPRMEVLVALCESLQIDKVIFNFAVMPVKMDYFVHNTDAEIFIHCHGFDVAFDGNSEFWPHEPIHPESYSENLLKLSEKATFISNSEFTSRQLRSIGIPESKIRLKYFGVEASAEFVPRKDYKRLSILHLGRLIDFKGPELTIQAFEQARAEGLDAELVIAGDGPLMITCELLKRKSVYSEDIRILGAVSREKASALYEGADIFTVHSNKGIMTNREEAFGVSVIEAMAAGLPVVAGRSGGIVESVVDGETGILFEPGDIIAQKDAFIRLASKPELRKSLGRSGWSIVHDNFSLEQERKNLKKILGVSSQSIQI